MTGDTGTGVDTRPSRAMLLVLGPPAWRHGSSPTGRCLVAACAVPAPQVGDNTVELAVDQRFGSTGVHLVGAAGRVGEPVAQVRFGLVDIGEITVTPGLHQGDDLTALAPLFLLGPDGEVYSATAETATRIVFLRCGDATDALGADGQLVDLSPVVAAHHRHADELNNHNNSHPKLRKWLPGEEIEQKFDLPADADVWAFTRDLLWAARRGELAGFVPHLRLPYTRWEFDNHLFEFVGPAERRGYVSFIPEAGKYIVKEKRFVRDQLRRNERVFMHIDIGASYEDYLARNYPEDEFVRHPSFRRLRYDIDVESLETGNHFVVSVDRCQVVGAPQVLAQCEVEYVDTRTLGEPRQVLTEHERLVAAVERRLAALDPGVRRSFTSKLTFLRSLPALNGASVD